MHLCSDLVPAEQEGGGEWERNGRRKKRRKDDTPHVNKPRRKGLILQLSAPLWPSNLVIGAPRRRLITKQRQVPTRSRISKQIFLISSSSRSSSEAVSRGQQEGPEPLIPVTEIKGQGIIARNRWKHFHGIRRTFILHCARETKWGFGFLVTRCQIAASSWR